ncbi:hypothetical protein N0V90_000466 [Kalmusia sp. IMI 367209]|nr:hypothetical protein N0V90_000466 [Kalmusia sp. IMI 367209]
MPLPSTAIAPFGEQQPVIFTPPRHLHHRTSGDSIGQLDARTAEFVRILEADGQLDLQLDFYTSPLATETSYQPPKGSVGFLAVIIYGPKHRSEDVQYFMTECRYYLDDPAGCNRNVPYFNPQSLFSFYEQPPMTFDLPQVKRQTIDDFTRIQLDILTGFETTDYLPESCSPDVLRTTLKVHQRQALTFFKRREQGLHPSKASLGIWSLQTNAENGNMYDSQVGCKKKIAITALRATSRWAISGTPVQNTIVDFFGLFKFLHFEPYDNHHAFNDEISTLWRKKPVEEAIETFKTLLSAVMLRRSKKVLSLPSREDKIIKLYFDPAEDTFYRAVERPVTELLDQTSIGNYGSSNIWLTAIQQINKLRLICNLGTALDYQRIQFVRIDGKVATKKRDQLIQAFQTDPEIRVILITMSCGACG